MKAKLYIYRNLHTNNFSVKYRGKVIKHIDSGLLTDVSFNISTKGQNRVRKNGIRNVHATISCKKLTLFKRDDFNPDLFDEIYYNPFKADTFIDSRGHPVFNADIVICLNNKIYKSKESL